jgi:hypothetical protein
MRVFGLSLAGLLVLAAPLTAFAVPLAGKGGPVTPSPAVGVEKVWGGCGWDWHPVPGHSSAAAISASCSLKRGLPR